MKYYIIAGEASGDLHGSNLMKGLFAEDPGCEVRFWGGDRMAAVGGTMVRHYKQTAVMGAVEVLLKARKIFKNLSDCKKDILQWKPDAVILIDYPGFNLKIARFAHENGFKIFYYIAPKVWARGEGRIKLLKKYVDMLYIIFPFEVDYFKSKGVEARYFGNPLIDGVSQIEVKNLAGGGKTIALLPGSRQAELKFLMPRMMELEKLLAADSRFADYNLVIAGAPSMDFPDYDKYRRLDSKIKVVFDNTYPLLKQAEAAVVSSGTASLEAALIGTPQVVCYGFNEVTYRLAKLTVHGIKYISLANLILDKLIFKELIQHNASPRAIYEELCKLVFDKDCRMKMEEDYKQLNNVLGGPGASARIAKDIYNETALL